MAARRRKNGQFPKGPMGERERREISKGQQRRFAALRELGLLPSWQPGDVKKCSKCGEWRAVPQAFSMCRRKLKSGGFRYYPAGECKTCASKRTAAWREAKKKEVGEAVAG